MQFRESRPPGDKDDLRRASHLLGECRVHPDDLISPLGRTLVATMGSEVAGLVHGHLESRKDFEVWLGTSVPVVLTPAELASPGIASAPVSASTAVPSAMPGVIGRIVSVAVDERYRGSGIGSLLMVRCLDWLDRHGAGMVAMIGWRRSDGSVRIESMALRLGFHRATALPWRGLTGGLTHDDPSCPECRPGLCRCAAVLYVRYAPAGHA